MAEAAADGVADLCQAQKRRYEDCLLYTSTILRLSPTDPIRTVLGDMATEEAVQEMREEMGLNDPFFVQFYNYIKGIVTKFDFGRCV